MKGVEPSSSAWKAEIISRYMTSAKAILYNIKFVQKSQFILTSFFKFLMKIHYFAHNHRTLFANFFLSYFTSQSESLTYLSS